MNELGQPAWLDREDAAHAIASRWAAGQLDEAQAVRCTEFCVRGWTVLRGAIEDELTGAIAAELDQHLAACEQLPRDELSASLQNLFPRLPATRRAMCHATLRDELGRLLGVRALPYQSLHLPVSSEHEAHSDEILMSTRPRGYMAAAWIALEDVGPEQGPVVLWPGSHYLPYLSARAVGVPETQDAGARRRHYDAHYFERAREQAEGYGVPPEPFTGRRGDVLIWHQALLHATVAPTRPGATRRSLVLHYFGEGAEHYSDLYARPCALPHLDELD